MNKQPVISYLGLFVPTNQSLLKESLDDSSKPLIVEGVVQRAGSKNQNGRIYPFEILKREVDKYVKSSIAENRALGELDHPESSIINLKNVSHNIKKLWWEGEDLMGQIEILCDRPGVPGTPSGNILRTLFKNNITVGISSRGMGSVQSLGEGTVEVQDDFDLLCWDFVSTPSTHGAFVKPINESFNPDLVSKYENVDFLVRDILCTLNGTCFVKK